MTSSKLPVIGKRYRAKLTNTLIEIKEVGDIISYKNVCGDMVIDHSNDEFWNDFEELPDQEPDEFTEEQRTFFEAGKNFSEIKASLENSVGISEKVEEAKEESRKNNQQMEELINNWKEVIEEENPRDAASRKIISMIKDISGFLKKNLSTSQNLIEALEEQKEETKLENKMTKKEYCLGSYPPQTKEIKEIIDRMFNILKDQGQIPPEAVYGKSVSSVEITAGETKLDEPKKEVIQERPKTLKEFAFNYDPHLELIAPYEVIDIVSAYLEDRDTTPEPEEEPESIWKPISELPDNTIMYVAKKIYINNKNDVALFSDILNQQEALAKNQRVLFAEIEKLKKK